MSIMAHRIEEVLDTIIKPKFTTFFTTDASNGYWRISMKKRNEYKTGVVTPHGHYFYSKMVQGLGGAPHIYTQLGDLTYGHLPKTEDEPAYDTLIKDYGNTGCALFMNVDHGRWSTLPSSCFRSHWTWILSWTVFFTYTRFGTANWFSKPAENGLRKGL